MKLLISPKNESEAQEAIAGGADIIDVKNPQEGPLGANFPWVIKCIKESTPKPLETSCTIGEAPTVPASMALAAYGAASLGVDYVKVGLSNLKTAAEASVYLEKIVKAAKLCNPNVKIVATGYADSERANSINPVLVPQVAQAAGADVAMLDTAVKDGKSTFDFLSVAQLEQFVKIAHEFGLQVALAGSLKAEDLCRVKALGADIVGVRGAACTGCDRIKGSISRKQVQALLEIVQVTP
ncbi:MAG: hypothetical protein NWF01_09265 [Candidatus Bathyarchaeota archaeon]|nr:hypothetical protein [Candidatus Bathyarchaeota archaeon]